MNLSRMLAARAAEGRPVRVGVIGCGKFGAMFLSQAGRTTGMHVAGVADLDLDRARSQLARINWPAERYGAASFADAFRDGTTFLTEDAQELIRTDGIEVIVEATGNPPAGIRHALACFEAGRHIVMVNVEADVLAGPLLARKAEEAGVACAMAYGDQPALIYEMVDWARTCGLEVVAAGKGTKHMAHYHQSTPETVWDYYGIDAERAALGGMNAQMFNSFVDGTKSGIEMAAVANATGLNVPRKGLSFRPASVYELADLLKPEADGGTLEGRGGYVEVISCFGANGQEVPHNLRQGVYVTFAGADEYVQRCFAEYHVSTDESGEYAALWRPSHLIGLELGVSVATAALRGESTGHAEGWAGDVVATAKRDLRAGEVLDGEGGYCVWGKLMPSADSLALGGLPIGLAHGVRLRNAIPFGRPVTWDDVEIDPKDPTVAFRREMERAFA
ncbi:MAG: SAF domain-containing protein [Alphaproteobacteria bacterium]|nr:SAF domain-containing protein [Alphaproteobacteria bacterium]